MSGREEGREGGGEGGGEGGEGGREGREGESTISSFPTTYSFIKQR